jgi:large subunit ribosomal protein L4
MAGEGKSSLLRSAQVPAAFAADGSDKRNAMFRAVFRELANTRAGTASTKRRDEVSGGGKKPWRQKGTGRARQGSTRSPQWRHGGVVFGPKPRSFGVSLNKKERKAAMRAALSDRFNAGLVTVLDTDKFAIEKTKDMAELLFGSPAAAKTGPRTLVVYATDEFEPVGQRIMKSGRNLERVGITHTGALDVKDVLGFGRLVLTGAALAQLSAQFEQPRSA